MKTKKPATKRKAQGKYFIAIRAHDDRFNEMKNEVFEFRSKKQRDAMAKICTDNKIEFSVSNG